MGLYHGAVIHHYLFLLIAQMTEEVLKAGHCLQGRDMFPLVRRLLELKAATTPPTPWARFTKRHKLPSYSLTELKAEFYKLTGYQISEVLPTTGILEDIAGCRLAAHAAIIQANLTGGPVARPTQLQNQPLQAAAPPTPAQDRGPQPGTSGGGQADDWAEDVDDPAPPPPLPVSPLVSV